MCEEVRGGGEGKVARGGRGRESGEGRGGEGKGVREERERGKG